MTKEDNLHKGHRQRLLEKLRKSQDVLADHEILEILLFYALPRIDTNPLAHRLIKAFGGLKGIAKATRQELLAINGVGEKTADLLITTCAILNRIDKVEYVAPEFGSTEKLKLALSQEFAKQAVESCVVLLLDKNYKELIRLTYSKKDSNEVDFDLNEIVNCFTKVHPVYAIMAHNHPLGDCYPSFEDDSATTKLYFLCQIHGVRFLEHAIFNGKGEFYSYREDGRLEHIKNQIETNTMLKIGGKGDNE